MELERKEVGNPKQRLLTLFSLPAPDPFFSPTKRTGTGGKKAPAQESRLKLVRLELTPDVHRDFRIEAAKEGVSMASLARRLVEEWTVKRKAGDR